ncbi:hypothetical protein KVB92_09540 [Lentilactobacillus parabuchneri]|uniref:hypothetical protein n=1 Tax=Lentilactobacillus parabuchneri TaxID=152331 RepID=UPI00080B57CB|nr:hypothetical protein [Lentilactobacillus parabuchneri]MBW0223446.1 hypothetical protein [Lentilactobacillus parabuchneri]OCB82610.1 hypothetical protein A7322_01115 [Lentilactobacillus parabuchneri]
MEEDDNEYAWLEIPSNTNYWLVRATGGKYYSDFLETSTISILNNKVSVQDINNSLEGNQATPLDGDVHALFANAYKYKNKHWVTNAARQADIFVNGMKNGDLVLVPSKSSNRFALGVVAGKAYDEDPDKLKERIHYAPLNGIGFSVSDAIKRRPVIWIKEISRQEFPPKLAWILTAHQTILPIGKNSHLINNLVSPLYVYKDELHLRAFSSKKEGLTLADWTSLSDFLKNSAADPDAEFKINMGADIHSPGFIELITSIQNYDYILNIVKTLWNATVDNHLNYPIGALAILSFLMGKEGRKQGLLQWLISVANNSEDLYQKHFTNKNKRKLANKSKQAAQVPLKIKDAGTSIELKSQKKNLDNQESQHGKKE